MGLARLEDRTRRGSPSMRSTTDVLLVVLGQISIRCRPVAGMLNARASSFEMVGYTPVTLSSQ